MKIMKIIIIISIIIIMKIIIIWNEIMKIMCNIMKNNIIMSK